MEELMLMEVESEALDSVRGRINCFMSGDTAIVHDEQRMKWR